MSAKRRSIQCVLTNAIGFWDALVQRKTTQLELTLMDTGFFSMATLWNVVFAILILIATYWLSGFVRQQVIKLGKAYEALDDTLFNFLGSLARYAVIAVGLIFVLGRFGIETTSLVALIGAAGLAIGLALQGTLSNIAAGVMLMIFRPFKLGDYITAAGHSGSVSDVKLFTTELTDVENVLTIIPNAEIWGSAIVNYSHYSQRRIGMTFGISYDSDINAAMQLIETALNNDSRVISDKGLFVGVTNLGDSSVDITVRAWCASEDYWGLKFDTLKLVKEQMDATGIDIPYPTQTLINKQG